MTKEMKMDGWRKGWAEEGAIEGTAKGKSATGYQSRKVTLADAFWSYNAMYSKYMFAVTNSNDE